MADYQIQLPTLSGKTRTFSGMKNKTDKNVESYESSSIKKAPSPISKPAARVANNMNRLRKGYTNSDSWFTNYVTEFTELENNLTNFSSANLKEPIVFNGVFEDIFSKITMPALKTGGDRNSNAFLGIIGMEHMVKSMFMGEDCWLVDTKISVEDYANYVYTHGLNQNGGLLPSDCMLLSQYETVDMIRGTYTSRGTMAAHQGAPAPRINKKCLSQNEQDVLDFAYNELTAGRPVVLQVTQVRSNEGLRHLVTLVGFKGNVKSSKDLNPSNMIVLDCVDGKLQYLGQSRSEGGHERRLFNQGGKGYYALAATDEFLAREVTGATSA